MGGHGQCERAAMKKNLFLLVVCSLLAVFVGIPGMQLARAAEAVKDLGHFEFRWVLGANEDGPLDELVWGDRNGGNGKTYQVGRESVVTDRDVSKAAVVADEGSSGKSTVLVEFWPEASERLLNATKAKLGHECAVLIDGAILNVNTVRGAVSNRMPISGMEPAAAAGLARLLNLRATAPVNQWLNPPQGVVLDPAGQPVAGANVVVLPSGTVIKGRTAKLSEQPFPSGVVTTKTGVDGGFKCDEVKAPYLLLAESAEGYGEVTGGQLMTAKEIRLAPFAKVGGRVYCGKEPYRNSPVSLVALESKHRVGSKPGEEVEISSQVFAKTDDEGKYLFEQVPQGAYFVCMANAEGTVPVYSTACEVEARSGESAECVVGEPIGGSVRGTLRLVRWNLPRVALDRIHIQLAGTVSGPLKEAMVQTAQAAWQEFRNSACGRTQEMDIKAQPDGSFHAEGLAAGRYSLVCSVSAEDIGITGDPRRVGGTAVSFVVKPKEKDIDLGGLAIGQDPSWKMPLTSRLWNWVSGKE